MEKLYALQLTLDTIITTTDGIKSLKAGDNIGFGIKEDLTQLKKSRIEIAKITKLVEMKKDLINLVYG